MRPADATCLILFVLLFAFFPLTFGLPQFHTLFPSCGFTSLSLQLPHFLGLLWHDEAISCWGGSSCFLLFLFVVWKAPTEALGLPPFVQIIFPIWGFA